MTAVTSYNEATLAQFMVDAIGPTVGGLTSASPLVTGAVTAVVRLLGAEIADLTDMALLEAAATWKAWEVAYSASLSSYTSLKAGTAAVSRDDFLANLITRLGQARSAYYLEASRAAQEAGDSVLFAFGLACGTRGR